MPTPKAAAPEARPELERLLEAGRRLNKEDLSAQVLSRLAVEGRDLAGADLAAVLVRAEPSRGWAAVSWETAAARPGRLGRESRFPAAPGTLVGEVLATKAARIAPDLELRLEAECQLGRAIGVRSLALVPVLCEGVTCAILALGWDPPGIPSERLAEIAALAGALAGYAGIAVENAALKSELEHGGLRAELSARAEGAEALHRVAADVAGRRDPEEIAGDAIEALFRLYGASAGAFKLLDEEGGILDFILAGISEAQFGGLEDLFSGRKRGAANLRTQVVHLAPGERRRPLRAFLGQAGFQSLVRVSAISQGRVVGRLILLHRQMRQYRLDELALLEAFAVQLAGGLRLAKAYSDLEAADRRREEFLAFIAHEVRHPVAAISTIAETLADTPGLGAPEQRALEGLRGQARLLTRMAEEVLQVAHMETQGIRLNLSQVDLVALLEALARQAPQPQRIELAPVSRRVRIQADPEQLGHALDNLLRNALKYSPGASPVEVSVTSRNKEVTIEVRDHGVGLAPAEIPQLFKKYGRVVNERTASTAGVGLGLYLTRLLIEAHRGAIAASSAGLGRGSTFTVVLPHDPASADVRS